METLVKEINDLSISYAVQILEKGGVIGMPTETVYGLAGIGLYPDTVKKIFEVKGRPSDNPLIAHVHKDYNLNKLCYIEHEYIYKLISKFMPGPLTLVMKSKGVICSEAICGGDTLAVRIPSHGGCQKLLKALDKPVVAPSANLSKHTSPVSAEHVFNDLSGKIPLILDGGKCSGGIESTVLDVTGKVPRVLRAGLITREMIKEVCGECEIAEHKQGDRVKSPGVKYSHYKPKCRTRLFNPQEIDELISLYDYEIAQGNVPYIMCQSSLVQKFNGKNLLLLGSTGEEIAHNLYDKLLEGEKVADVILAVSFDREDGVYLGIMNRLRKACG